MQWCYWWCCSHVVTLMQVPMASSDKIHAVSDFNCFDLRNKMVPFYDIGLMRTDTSANIKPHFDYLGLNKYIDAIAIIWPKSHVCFDHLDLTNGVVPLMTLLASCDTDININDITLTKKLCCTSFWLSWLNKCNGAIDDVISTTWPKSHVTSHFALDLTNGMVPLMTLLASHNTDTSINCTTWPGELLHIVSVMLTLWIQWCYWQFHWHHVMLMSV